MNRVIRNLVRRGGQFAIIMNELRIFLNQFTDLSQQEAEEIAENLLVETYKKGTTLLSEGEISTNCYFVLKGCIREYSMIDGEEKTTGFYTENQAAVAFSSYAQQTPAKHFFSCSEETIAIVGNPEKDIEMVQQFPKLELIIRTMLQSDFGKTQEDFAAFIVSSPEERYLKLVNERPDLIQRVPLHQLASYLGVTPESLSRIRKRTLLSK